MSGNGNDRNTQQNKPKRPRLADLIGNGGKDDLVRAWAVTEAAPAFALVPKGRYLLEAVAAKYEKSKKDNLAYLVRFRVLAPGTPQHGQLIFHRFYLTEAAIPMSKRDLLALGISTPEQLDQPLPQGLRVMADVAVRTRDDGTQHNELRNLIAAPPAPADPFTPDAETANKLDDDGPATVPEPSTTELTTVQDPAPPPAEEPPTGEPSPRKRRKRPEGPSLYSADEPAADGPYQGDRP